METEELAGEEAIAWLAELFDEPVANLSVDTDRNDVAGWESLGVLTLIAELDEKFEINEPDVEEMAKVGDIIGCLREHGKLKAS
jgi:acyl carrier protein